MTVLKNAPTIGEWLGDWKFWTTAVVFLALAVFDWTRGMPAGMGAYCFWRLFIRG